MILNKWKTRYLIESITSNGTNGFCLSCGNYFKTGDEMIIFEKGKINQIAYIKVCAKCYIKGLITKIGFKKTDQLIKEIIEEKI